MRFCLSLSPLCYLGGCTTCTACLPATIDNWPACFFCGRERAVIILARVPVRGCVSLPCVIVLLIWWDCRCGISVLRVLVHGGGIMLRRVQATCSTTCNANVDPGHPKHTPLPPTPPRNRLRSDKKTKQAPTCAFERHFITRNGQNSPAAGGFAPGPPVAFLLRLDLGVPAAGRWESRAAARPNAARREQVGVDADELEGACPGLPGGPGGR